MFKYLALGWDPRDGEAATTARHLAGGLENDRTWRAAFQGLGLAVFTSGETPNVNQSYPLAGARGVVLGKLFGHDGAGLPRDHFTAHVDESEAIVRTGGLALVERCWGRYVAWIESEAGGFLALRDPSGTLPCFKLRQGGVDVVFSWLEDVLEQLPSIPRPAVDWECLAAHIASGELTGHPTALAGISQVLAGEAVPLGGRAGQAHFLWSPVEQAGRAPVGDAEQSAKALRDVVRRCVLGWASCYESLVLRLSGGVDSSILASCLSGRDTRSRVTCLNYHSPGSDSDERSYARLAAHKAGRELVESERDPHFRLEQVLDVARTPSPLNYLGRFGARTDAAVAAAVGAPAMFTGAGGDQLFLEFGRWWPAADYLRLEGFGAGFLAAAMDAARLGKVSVWRAARLAIGDRFRHTSPPPHTTNPWSLASGEIWETMQHTGRFLHPAHDEAACLPIGKLMQVRQVTHFGGYYDFHQRDRAPEQVNPLLSQPLIELCLLTPTYVLTIGGRGRALARRAFAKDLPPEIAARRSKGGLQEQIAAVLVSNIAFVREILLDGELVKRGLVD